MFPPAIAANLEIILVEPLYPGNIGQTARAMANFGLSCLGLVKPPEDYLGGEARKMALAAEGILRQARVYTDLNEAVAHKNLVVGTTRRHGRERKHFHTPRGAAPLILETAAEQPAAILFGKEDFGLSNRDLNLCQMLVYIPVHPDFASLNVAQAVLLFAYELFMSEDRFSPHPPLKRVDGGTLESMYAHWEQALLKLGYLHANNPGRIISALRRLFGRTGLEDREVQILRGICSQIEWLAEKEEQNSKDS